MYTLYEANDESTRILEVTYIRDRPLYQINTVITTGIHPDLTKPLYSFVTAPP